MFSLNYGRHVGVPQRGLHSELYKFAWNVSANNYRMVYRTDLKLGEVVYLLIFCNIFFFSPATDGKTNERKPYFLSQWSSVGIRKLTVQGCK